jgi:predicted nucleotidyltransferase
MEDTLTFGLSDRIRSDIRQVFAHYPAIERVLIFGSRAKGSAGPGSDIDLAVVAPEMSDAEFARLWNAIEDLPLVFKVDLLHWDRLSNPRLKDKIPREGCLFYARPTDRRAEVAA